MHSTTQKKNNNLLSKLTLEKNKILFIQKELSTKFYNKADTKHNYLAWLWNFLFVLPIMNKFQKHWSF